MKWAGSFSLLTDIGWHVPRQCLFCKNRADSAEHIWSDWILRDLKLSTTIKATIAGRPSFNIATPEIKVRCVCASCNNRWMSELETENKSPIHAMINDDPCSLSKNDQNRLARWAVLKAMVIEATNRKRECFYNAHDKVQIKSA